MPRHSDGAKNAEMQAYSIPCSARGSAHPQPHFKRTFNSALWSHISYISHIVLAFQEVQFENSSIAHSLQWTTYLILQDYQEKQSPLSNVTRLHSRSDCRLIAASTGPDCKLREPSEPRCEHYCLANYLSGTRHLVCCYEGLCEGPRASSIRLGRRLVHCLTVNGGFTDS